MLKSMSLVGRRAKALIEHYATTVDGQIEGALKPQTGDPASAHDVRLIADKCRDLARAARRILDDPEAELLTAEEREDLVAIAEEMEIGATEADSIADPDAVFAEQTIHIKRRLTERVPIKARQADSLRARIRGDIRKQKDPPRQPPTNNPGGPPK